MNVYLEGLLWVLGAGAIAGGVLYLQHRYRPSDLRAEYNDVTGAFFEIIGVLYAVMLAFIVITVWDAMGEAEDNSYREANSLVQVYWTGHNAPEPQRSQIEQLSRDYATQVADREWPRMVAGVEVSSEGWQILDDLRTQVESLTSNDQVTRGRYEDAAKSLAQLNQDRQARLAAVGDGVSSVLWFVLISGGLLFVASAYLFGVPDKLAHIAMVVSVTMMVTLLLYAVYQLEQPFGRGAAIGPDAMRFALDRFSQISG